MPSIKYIFNDMRSGAILYEMPLRGVRMTAKLNDWGAFNGTFSLDESGHDNADLLNCSLPGKCGVTVERDNVPIWDGIVWARTYQSQAKSVQLSARTREAYLEKIKVETDFIRTDYEQRNIMRELFNQLQADPNNNLLVTVPGSFSNMALKSVEVLATDLKNYFQVVSSIADGENGFDWTIAITKSGNNYVRTLRIGYPVLGTAVAGVSLDYPGNITDYYKSESMTPAGTHIFVPGAGEGSTMPIGTHVHSDMLATGWLAYDVIVPRKDLSDQAQVDDFAARLAIQRRPPYTTIKVFVKSDLEPYFGSYGLGDSAQVAFADPRHPGGISTVARLVAYAYWPPSSEEIEKAELIFEGDELNDG